MFYYLKGTVEAKEQNMLCIDVSGVGYMVHSSFNTISKVELHKSAKVFTYTHIREDMFDIYGFLDLEELNFFKLLISISGVGPKAALSILSVADPSNLALAIITGDEKLITKAQGIGKKIASRIVLELKDKISKEKASVSTSIPTELINADTNEISEAISALMVLGYSQSEATLAIKGIDEALKADEIIKIGLKNLMKQI